MYKKAGNKGVWLQCDQPASINEWTIHGVSTEVVEQGAPGGWHCYKLRVSFHISRRWEYYFWKALLPLYMVAFLSFGVYEFPIDDIEASPCSKIWDLGTLAPRCSAPTPRRVVCG